ncbi:hypothetical protein BLA23254_02195 [Burkholderia lata]|uniref:Uncharacterized protein n=1 Tax=Burkholderia lata (strain ATCC 17760 / DSM 23089 / LMG 22485 / NCIMB 9086 / R18194 / 383) TaxID=482957 RepID=A0A6P2JZJ4_BURL3|nr:hypothetical protein BLA23254_02195 [Burkholderia lata]
MSPFSFLSLCVAIAFAVGWSIVFLTSMFRKKEITWGDVKTWIKNVFDSLFGMG